MERVKSKGYKTISKTLEVPLTSTSLINLKFKVHRTGNKLPGHGHSKKTVDQFKKMVNNTNDNQRAQNIFQNVRSEL